MNNGKQGEQLLKVLGGHSASLDRTSKMQRAKKNSKKLTMDAQVEYALKIRPIFVFIRRLTDNVMYVSWLMNCISIPLKLTFSCLFV